MKTLNEIEAARGRITGRHGQAAIRIQELESGLTRRLIDYANGLIDRAVLDSQAAELATYREIVKEDISEALNHFDRLGQDIAEKMRMEQNKIEALGRRREFATQYNFILSRTIAPNLPEIEALAPLFPSDYPGYQWHRFKTARIDFAALPDGEITYGEFCGLEQFDPEV